MKEKLIKSLLIAVVIGLSGILFCCEKGNQEQLIQEEASGENAEAILADEKEESCEAKPETTEKTTYICIYVCGAVVNPGVYSVPENSRKYEAIALAGGMTGEAAAQALNLAEILTDGEKLQVPTKEEVESGAFSGENSGQSSSSGENSGLVNINQADASLLMTLPGIGEGKANAIITYRQDHGNFKSVEELMEVEGIKQGVYNKLKDKICI